MPSERSAGVWLAGRFIGRVTSRSRTAIAFEYDDEILAAYPLNTPLLSCSLPTRRGRQNARAFMGGLLPEGDARRYLAEQARCVSTDVFALLDAFGRDVAGAVWISQDAPTEDEGYVLPYTDASLDAEVQALQDRPLAFHDDSALSIAGIQNKMLLVQQPDGTWGRPAQGFPSTHILKVDDQRHRGLVRAEHTCLELARAAGIPAATSNITPFGEIDCIIVERFDRSVSDDRVVRLHQEDACQALGIDLEVADPRAKYESHGGPSLRQVANTLAAHAVNPEQELLRLLDQVTFTVVIGNADHHAKNISFLHTQPGLIELAPLYDTVPTSLWPNLDQRAAMSIGAAVDLPDITVSDLVREARTWGLPQSLTRDRIQEVLERLREGTSTVQNAGDLDVVTVARTRAEELLDATVLSD